MNDKKDIVINRMYVGDYLTSNLGHEIINLFRADNDKHYLYLNPTGNVEYDSIGYMLMVKNFDTNTYEIIGLAEGFKRAKGAECRLKKDIGETVKKIHDDQEEFINKENVINEKGNEVIGIKYDGVSILDIFKNYKQQSIFITYQDATVYVPKKGIRIFIQYGEERNQNIPNAYYIKLNGYKKPGFTLRQYIWENPKKPSKSDDISLKILKQDYDNCMEIISNKSLWTTDKDWKVNVNEVDFHAVSLFDICRIQDDENRISYALSYFMLQPEYREMWTNFFKDKNVKEQNQINLSYVYEIEREKDAKITNDEDTGGRIDIFIKDDKNKNLIVIENKIKSSINTIKADKKKEGKNCQLTRYTKYIQELLKKDEFKDYKSYFILLVPEYNKLQIERELKQYDINNYKVTTYKDLYDFLGIETNKKLFENDHNFMSFYNLISRHANETANGFLYQEMREKLARRIIESKN